MIDCPNRILWLAGDDGTGTAPGTAIGTTAALVLYNPQTSTHMLRIWKVGVGYVSGTLGAGTLFHCANATTTQTAPSGGTACTERCLRVGSGFSPVASAIVGATVVAPFTLWPMLNLTALLATTASSPYMLWEPIYGDIVIMPGCTYQLQAVAASGSTPKIAPAVVWEEVSLA